MATKNDIKRVFSRALERFPDSVRTAVFQRVTSGGASDNPTIESTTTVNNTLQVQYNSSEINGSSIMVGDFKIMLFANELPDQPQSGDSVNWNGVDVTIINAYLDPSGAVYILQVRQT